MSESVGVCEFIVIAGDVIGGVTETIQLPDL
jgi:hypothetical protein